jgi:hypothetical protein
VGVAFIEAVPRKASVTVNGVEYGTLPRAIPNLEPGLATIRVTKEGYQPWEKQLPIEPAKATDARFIKLLPEVFEQDIILGNAKLFSVFEPTGSIAAVTSDNRVLITDEFGKPRTTPITLSRTPIHLAWSSDGTAILVSFSKNTYEILRIQGSVVDKISASSLASFDLIKWDSGSSSTIYARTPSHSVISYDVQTGTVTNIAKDIATYTLSGRDLIVQHTDSTLHIQRIGSHEERNLTSDINQEAQMILQSREDHIAILCTDGTLKVLPKNGALISIGSGVQRVSWSPDGQLLLVQTAAGELRVYNVETEYLAGIPPRELHQVVRLSRPISNPQWMPDSQHIVYESDGTTIISEIDTRDHAITRTVDTGISSNIVASSDGKSLLFIKSINERNKPSSLVRTWLMVGDDQ